MPHHRLRRLVAAAFVIIGSTVIPDRPVSAIVNGTPITASTIPWLAKIEGSAGTCTGSLVASTWVLTAAHCDDGATGITSVAVGGGTPRSVESVFIHPSYDPVSFDNDIALVHLASAVSNPLVTMAGVSDGLSVGSALTLAGWGLRTAAGSAPSTPTQGSTTASQLTSTTILAGASPATACSGDSGGPMLSGSTLVGVISFGDQNCASITAGPRLSGYRTWILDTIASIPAEYAQSPVAVSGTFTGTAGQTVDVTLDWSDPDPTDDPTWAEGDNWTLFSGYACSPGGPPVTCSITTDPVMAGLYPLTYVVTDLGGNTSTATVTLDLLGTAVAPVGSDQLVSVGRDGSTVIDLDATDTNLNPLTFTVVEQPEFGSLSCSFNLCAYDPDSGFVGADRFTWSANDGASDSDVATVAITVTPGPGLGAVTTGLNDPAAVLSALVGGDPVSNVTLTGASSAFGSFAGGGLGIGQGVVLGSASVINAERRERGVGNDDLGSGGSSLLAAESGMSTGDAATLEFDVTPSGDVLEFDLVFASAEWFAGGVYSGDYNDAAVVAVDGVPCRVGSGTPISIAGINQGVSGGSASNPSLYVPLDTQTGDPSGYGVAGMTSVLRCSASVTPGVSHHIEFGVADGFTTDDQFARTLGSFLFISVPGPVDTVVSVAPVGTAAEGEAVAVTGDAGDSAVPILTEWVAAEIGDVRSGGTCTFDDPLDPTTNVTCSDDGVYLLSMIAEGSFGRRSTGVELVVGNVAPSGSIVSPSASSIISSGSELVLVSTVSDPGTSDALTCQVRWGDGRRNTRQVASGSCAVGHTYAESGVYEILVTYSDDDGATDTDSMIVVVADPPRAAVEGTGSFSQSGRRVRAAVYATPSTGVLGIWVDGVKAFSSLSFRSMRLEGEELVLRFRGEWRGTAGRRVELRIDDGAWGPNGGRDDVSIVVRNAAGTVLWSSSGAVTRGDFTVRRSQLPVDLPDGSVRR